MDEPVAKPVVPELPDLPDLPELPDMLTLPDLEVPHVQEKVANQPAATTLELQIWMDY